MSIQEIGQMLGPLAMLLTIINFGWSWHNAARLPTQSAIRDLEGEAEDHARRIQSLESEVKHLPTKDEITQLRLQLADVIGQLRTSQTEMGGVLRTLRRLEDHLRGVGV